MWTAWPIEVRKFMSSTMALILLNKNYSLIWLCIFELGDYVQSEQLANFQAIGNCCKNALEMITFKVMVQNIWSSKPGWIMCQWSRELCWKPRNMYRKPDDSFEKLNFVAREDLCYSEVYTHPCGNEQQKKQGERVPFSEFTCSSNSVHNDHFPFKHLIRYIPLKKN